MLSQPLKRNIWFGPGTCAGRPAVPPLAHFAGPEFLWACVLCEELGLQFLVDSEPGAGVLAVIGAWNEILGSGALLMAALACWMSSASSSLMAVIS